VSGNQDIYRATSLETLQNESFKGGRREAKPLISAQHPVRHTERIIGLKHTWAVEHIHSPGVSELRIRMD